MIGLTFPPLMSGEATEVDPFALAIARAEAGCDAGLILYRLAADRIGAALVLAPEVPLAPAMAMLPLGMVAFQNALGTLAPPELPVLLEWSGGIRINGGFCGGFRAAASTADPQTIPDWLVVGFELQLISLGETTDPDRTALYEEGCGEVDTGELVEAWARHALNWIARWEDEGARPLHAEWAGLAHGLGAPTRWHGWTGIFLGVDEDFGMLLQEGDTTRLIPLTDLLETPR